MALMRRLGVFPTGRATLGVILRVVLAGLVVALVWAGNVRSPIARATGQEGYTSLQTGFTQDVFAVHQGFIGGIAFGPNSVISNPCAFSGGSLYSFDSGSTYVLHGSTLHTETIMASNAGCGLANHPNGYIYSNTALGVVKLDPTTGNVVAGPFGPAGDALGIVADPQTGNLVYVGSSSTGYILYSVNPSLTSYTTFSSALSGIWLDGITFDPTGAYLFVSARTGCECLSILRRDGTLVQNIPASHIEPDGIAFNSGGTQSFNNGGPFVITVNTDGTITSYVFPNNDFTQTPVQSVFASGGFRGDLSQVGSDSCIYVPQDGVRYADGTVGAGYDSIVRICGGIFVPPVPTNTSTPTGTPGASTATPTPHSQTAMLTLNANVGVFGQTIVVSGTGFGNTESVNVFWDSTASSPLAIPTTSGAGTFTTQIPVPAPITGTHTIIAVGQSSGQTASASYRVIVVIGLGQLSGPARSTNSVVGEGFGPRETVTAYWGPGLVLGTTTTDAHGFFSAARSITFTVPMSATGRYPIYAIGAVTHNSSNTTFTLAQSS